MLLFCSAIWRTQVERAAALLAADTVHTLQLVTATRISEPVEVSYQPEPLFSCAGCQAAI